MFSRHPTSSSPNNSTDQATDIPPPARPLRPSAWPRRLTWLLLPIGVVLATGAWFFQARYRQLALQQAEVAEKRFDFKAAAQHWDEHLEQNPDDGESWLNAARTARRLGRYSDAEAHLTRCQELVGVTEATRLEWDLLRIQQGDLGEAHLRLRHTIGPEHPDAPLVLEALARGYIASDRLLDAMEACDLWIARQPEHPWAWLWRGAIYERLANFDQALADFQRALELSPRDSDIRLALGNLLLRGRRPAPAAEHFEYVLQGSPEEPEALLGLAACKIEQGDTAAAIPLLERVIANHPENARALTMLGKTALENRDAAAAERWLARAIKIGPADPEALHQFALALRAQGKHAAADELSPRLESVRKDIERLDRLTRVIARNPEDARPRHEAGTIALRIGRLEDGVRLLQSALRCEGEHRATHLALADHFAGQGDSRAETHRRFAEEP